MKWKTLESGYITKYPYFTSRKDKCQMPDGRIVPSYYVVELPPSVCAVCMTKNNEVLLVRQYRHPIDDVILELPGGFVDNGETPDQAIERELQEEIAYSFDEIIPVGKIAANPGVLNNFTYFYLAKGGTPHGHQKFDAHEFLKVEKVSLEKLKNMLLQNEIVQSLHANCVFYALRELGEL
jgi:ADP-ribose pyrophosphatase YjhB (NUDIX family)